MHSGFGKTASFIFILGMLLLALNVAVNNPYCHNLIRAALNEKIKKYTSLEVNYQALEVKLFPPGLTLYGVTVAPRDALDTKYLEAAHISTRLSVISLLLGKPRLALLEFNELQTAFPTERPLDQLFALPSSKVEQEPPAPLEWPLTYHIPLNRLVLINSKLRLKIPDAENPASAPALDVRLGGANLDLDMADLARFSGKISLHSVDLFTWGRHVAKSVRVDTHFDYRNNVLKTQFFQLSAPDAHLNGELGVQFDVTNVPLPGTSLGHHTSNRLDGLKLTMHATNADCDLAVLGRFLNIDETGGVVRGDINLTVDIPLHEKKNVFWQVEGGGAAQNGLLYGFRLHDSTVSYVVNEKAVTFPSIEVIKDDRVLGKGKGRIALDDALSLDFSVAPEGLLLSELLTSLGVDNFNVVDASLSSDNIRIAGNGFPFHMTVESPLVRATDIVSPLVQIPTGRFPVPPSCTARLFMDINAQKLSFHKTEAFCRDNNSQQETTVKVANDKIGVEGDLYFNNAAGVNLRLQTSSFSAATAQYFTQIPWQGSLGTDVRISGPYDRMSVNALIASQDLMLFNTGFRQARGIIQVNIHEKKVNFKDISLHDQHNGKIELSEGSIDFDDELSSAFTGRIEAVERGLIQNIVAWSDSGRRFDCGIRQAEFKLKGPLLYPFAYHGHVRARLANGTFGDERLFSLIDGAIDNDGGDWHTRDLSYDIDDFHITLDLGHKRSHPFSMRAADASSVWYERLGLSKDDIWRISMGTGPFDKPAAMTRHHGKKSGDQLQILPFFGPYLRQIGLSGSLNLAMEMEGPLNRLQGHFKGEIYRLNLFSSAVGPLTAEGFIHGGQIDIPTLTQSSKSLMGRFKVDLQKAGFPFEWYMSFNKYDLRALTPDMFHHDPRNYSYVSGNWKMKGEFADFWRASCAVQVDDFKINYLRDVEDRVQRETLSLDKPASLSCENGHWFFLDEAGATMHGSAGYVNVRTQHNILPENLDVVLDGNAKLALLPKFLPLLDKASGAVKMTGTIRGHIDHPDIQIVMTDAPVRPAGQGEQEPVDISFLDFPPALRHLSFEVAYHENAIELRRFSAEKGASGRIQASGTINLADDDPERSQINISFSQAELNRFPLPFIKMLDTTISGNLVLTGKELPLKLSGVINVDRAQSYANFDIRDQILDIFQKKKFSTVVMPQEPILALDIKVLAGNTIKIKNRSVGAVLASELTVTGTDSAPILGGKLTIPEGKFTYKREFTLTRGNIIFDEMTNPPDPKLEINGSTVVSSYTVNVAVTGHASDPKVAFSIDPSTRSDGSEISTKDIVLLLSSGKNPNTTDDTHMEKELSNEALYLLVGQFEHPIERLFDWTGQTVVRQIYLDVHASKDTGDPIPRVNLPINLTDDANLILQVDRESTYRLSYEYSLNEAVSVYGSLDKAREDATTTPAAGGSREAAAFSTDTEPGVDLKFRFSFP